MSLPEERPAGTRKATWQRLQQAVEVIDGLADYWPLTLRQIYYQLVAALIIRNNTSEYKGLSRLLSEARLKGWVDWAAMEDRSRTFLPSGGWEDRNHFVREQAGDFLTGYRRDLLQTQGHQLEVWVEKDALAHIAHRVAFPFCVGVASAKGFTSTDYLRRFCDRVFADERERAMKILYFGDFDPSGWCMPYSQIDKLEQRMGMAGRVELKHVALLPSQIEQHALPTDFSAIKEADSRNAAFFERFGREVAPVELDALPPATLESLIEDAIRQELDLSAFSEEQALEQADCKWINDRRKEVDRLVRSW